MLKENVLIKQNFERVMEQIAKAACAVGRNPDSVRLIVVTKGQPLDKVEALLEAGARDLGENYVEEAAVKMAAFADIPGIIWHMIGHVQSRKARLVFERFDWVHSLDRFKLAEKFERIGMEINRTMPVLLECNVSGEASKFGWQAWNENEWDKLSQEIEPLTDFNHLSIKGLMTMPPYFENPGQVRPYFKRLRQIQDFLRKKFPAIDWDELSMGMSADFDIAIQEGATMVRVGTAIMGARSISFKN